MAKFMSELFHSPSSQDVNIYITLLPYEYNMNDMHRKGILDEDLTMTKTGWIYQYNAIPNNKDYEAATYWMQKTYEHLYGKLND